MFFNHNLLETLSLTLVTWNLACVYVIPLWVIPNGQNFTIYPKNIYLRPWLTEIMEPRYVFCNIWKKIQRILTKLSGDVECISSIVISEFQHFMTTHIHAVWKMLTKLRFSSNFELKLHNLFFWTRLCISMWKMC